MRNYLYNLVTGGNPVDKGIAMQWGLSITIIQQQYTAGNRTALDRFQVNAKMLFRWNDCKSHITILSLEEIKYHIE